MKTEIELLQELKDAIAQAKAEAANANAAATTANAAADQASAGALGGVAGARTQSNAEQASVNDTIFKSVQQDSDIGIPEAWSANVKRTYDLHQTDDFEARMRNRVQFDAIISEQTKHLANLNQLTLQSLANNQNQSNLNNTLSIDRSWNVNETDAFAVLLNKVVSDAVKQAIK
jgi:hypothetical protein